MDVSKYKENAQIDLFRDIIKMISEEFDNRVNDDEMREEFLQQIVDLLDDLDDYDTFGTEGWESKLSLEE